MPLGRSWFLEGWNVGQDHPWRVALAPLPFRIGRSSHLDLPIGSSLVSKQHAEIFEEDDTLFIRDLESRNGTMVNLEPVHGAQELRDGDLIWLANQECRLIAVQWPENLNRAEDPDTGAVLEAEDLAPRMRTLLSDGAFHSHFQPVVQASGQTFGYELLSRGDLEGLPQAPNDLFRIAEPLGLGLELSSALRSQGLSEARKLPSGRRIFLNTHPREIASDALLTNLRAFRNSYLELPLVLEIHEMAIDVGGAFQAFRREVDGLGIELAFDDFGAGPTRLHQLTGQRPQMVKFDRRLIRRLHEATPRRVSGLSDLIGWLHDAGVLAVAEGIESPQEASACRNLGFDLLQGYHFGRPEPAESWAN